MPATTKTVTKYGQLRWTERLGMAAKLIPLPAAVLWNVLTTAHTSFNADRSLRRVALDATHRYFAAHQSIRQMQSAFGTTRETYTAWTRRAKLPVVVDELGEDARLFWIGPKRLERVVLFSHGGGFLFPASNHSISFWRYVQLELEKQGIEVGLVLLSYSLSPTAGFPTPLKQARLALNFLLDAGVNPQNLQLVGDSAGANLLLQLLSHMLHPRPDVPALRLPAPLRLRGVLLISPWTNLAADSASHAENDGRDFLGKAGLAACGAQILADVPEGDDRVYVEAVRAPEGWFSGVDALVERVLITAGGAELMRDDIVVVGEALKRHHPRTEVVVQKNGLHEDMYLDFAAGEKKLGSLTPLTVAWLAAGFSASAT
ncbi:Alpha/Beta hydrolase protein [Mycena filopes]|nr:Alpha/Beta hydrolase protein [Mycena filopes]